MMPLARLVVLATIVAVVVAQRPSIGVGDDNSIVLAVTSAANDFVFAQPGAPNVSFMAEVSMTRSRLATLEGQMASLISMNTALQTQVSQQSSTISMLNNTVQRLNNQLNNQTAVLTQQMNVTSGITAMLTPFPTFDKLRVGNTVFSMWRSGLPVQRIERTYDTRCTNGSDPVYRYGSGNGGADCGYADTPYLSLKTNYVCGAGDINDMYHVQFKGHIFRDSESFTCTAVGYLYGALGHTFNQSTCSDYFPSTSQMPMVLTTYCGPVGGTVVFRFFDPNWAADRWHASDIVMDYIGGGGSYIGRGADTLQILDAVHHVNAMVF